MATLVELWVGITSVYVTNDEDAGGNTSLVTSSISSGCCWGHGSVACYRCWGWGFWSFGLSLRLRAVTFVTSLFYCCIIKFALLFVCRKGSNCWNTAAGKAWNRCTTDANACTCVVNMATCCFNSLKWFFTSGIALCNSKLQSCVSQSIQFFLKKDTYLLSVQFMKSCMCTAKWGLLLVIRIESQ